MITVAFMGVVLMFLAMIVIILIVGVVPIVVGTFLYHKTKHKKLGIAFRIFGYIVILPIIIVCISLFMLNKS